MSEQPPLTPPSGSTPVYPAYDAPAWGEASPEPSPVPPPAATYQVPAQYAGGYGAPTHPLATTSLALGIVGLVSLVLTPIVGVTIVGTACSPIAIGLAVRARRQIAADRRLHSGEGLATAGLVVGIVGTVLAVLAIAVVIAAVVFVLALFSSG